MKNISVLNLLTIIFIGLKVFNVITWSWFLVLLPTIISFSLGIIFLIILLIITLISLSSTD